VTPGLTIGRIAAAAQVTPDTIRYYERRGLLPRADRTPAGYRVYSMAIVRRLAVIRNAQRFGFSLAEIAAFLQVRDKGGRPCETVRRAGARKLAAVDERIAELKAKRLEIARTLRGWDSRLERTRGEARAYLLESLAGGGGCAAPPPIDRPEPRRRTGAFRGSRVAAGFLPNHNWPFHRRWPVRVRRRHRFITQGITMTATAMPSADIVFDTLFAYQRSAALGTAIELGVFTAIDEGRTTAAAIAERCGASQRGARILADFLTTIGLLSKAGDAYQLVPESAAFLSQRSPAYLGTTARFLLRPELKSNFDKLTSAVRNGGVAPDGDNTVSEENPIWVEFAHAMMPMMIPAAHAIAELVGGGSDPARVLDIAAGHGAFGITIAQRNPRAEIVATDWPSVLAVASAHAKAAQVQDRYRTLPGDAFKVDFGTGFDAALVTNFLHHFDAPTCTSFLKKVHAALKPGGRVAVLEFVPNADRVTPPMVARFSLTMLAGTPSGDAYTMAELRTQLQDAGFSDVSSHALPTPETVIVGRRA
jgi:DNA-binding transcriptional MerR regulator/ubiquinone/menaquinone biosynthesis C-methylase UbiE